MFVQLLGGILLALLMWNVLKLSAHTLVGVVLLTLLIGFIIPGLLIILGGLVFVGIGLLATLGLLVLLSALSAR